MSEAINAPGSVLFSEPGARWRAIAYGPALCTIILVIEVIRGGAIHWFGLAFCALLLAGFVWLQVVAGRMAHQCRADAGESARGHRGDLLARHRRGAAGGGRGILGL